MSQLPASLVEPAASLERLGRGFKHELGEWEVASVAFEADDLPPEVKKMGVRSNMAIELPRLTCRRCGAWVQFLNALGVNASSPTYDQECTGDHTS